MSCNKLRHFVSYGDVMKIVLNEKTKQLYISNMIDNLAILRGKLGMTQAQLAERLGISRQTMTAIENRSRALSWSNYLALCFLFENAETTAPLLELYDICPEIVRNYISMK